MSDRTPVRRRKRLLSTDLIVNESLALIAETGRLNMTDLANRLGSSASSIYHHVNGQSEILALIRDRVISPIAETIDDNQTWQEQIRRWLTTLRGRLALHPRLVPLLVAQQVNSSPEIAAYERVAAILAGAGFPEQELLLWISVLDQFAIGSALDLTSAEETWHPDPDGEHSPALTRAVANAPKGSSRADGAFDLGATALIVGMEAHLRTS